jgi:hypothetical protein
MRVKSGLSPLFEGAKGQMLKRKFVLKRKEVAEGYRLEVVTVFL